MIINKNKKSINPEFKVSIVGTLFSHILNSKEKKIEKITADLNFFNSDKENYFKLIKIDTTPINGNKKEIQSILSFTQIEKKVYFKSIEKKENVIKIEHHNSRLLEELQVVDLLCGAIATKFEKNNQEYFEIISNNKISIIGGETTFKNK